MVYLIRRMFGVSKALCQIHKPMKGISDMPQIRNKKRTAPKKIQHMTRAEFAQFVETVDVSELGTDRNAWQNKAKAEPINRVIPSDWLTTYLTRAGTRQRQQSKAADHHVPRIPLAARQ